jgi:hypothetical protein
MRRLLYLAFFMVACAGGQTHDPGATAGAGGTTTISPSGGSGGSTVGGAGGRTTAESGGAGGTTTTIVDKCGNGIVDLDVGEQCDGSNLNGETCASLQPGWSGKLHCDDNCNYDNSMCIPDDSGKEYGD